MNTNSCDQPEKSQKFDVTPQKKDKTNQIKQETKVSKKVRKNIKQKSYRVKQDRDRQEDSTPALGTKTTLAKKKTDQNQGQNGNQNQDVSEITWYRYNKKSHHAKKYTEPKNERQYWRTPRR